MARPAGRGGAEALGSGGGAVYRAAGAAAVTGSNCAALRLGEGRVGAGEAAGAVAVAGPPRPDRVALPPTDWGAQSQGTVAPAQAGDAAHGALELMHVRARVNRRIRLGGRQMERRGAHMLQMAKHGTAGAAAPRQPVAVVTRVPLAATVTHSTLRRRTPATEHGPAAGPPAALPSHMVQSAGRSPGDARHIDDGPKACRGSTEQGGRPWGAAVGWPGLPGAVPQARGKIIAESGFTMAGARVLGVVGNAGAERACAAVRHMGGQLRASGMACSSAVDTHCSVTFRKDVPHGRPVGLTQAPCAMRGVASSQGRAAQGARTRSWVRAYGVHWKNGDSRAPSGIEARGALKVRMSSPAAVMTYSWQTATRVWVAKGSPQGP